MTGRRASRWQALLGVVALSVAACSAPAGVTTKSADKTFSVPRVTSPPGTTAAPDASELPALLPADAATTSATLDNGLRYLIRENDNPGGKVELRLVINAGSGHEDASQVGGAHFLEHMLFNGTERFPKNELISLLRSFGAGFGADINASTSRDETIYKLTVPNDEAIVDIALDVLEQWLSFATIAADDVEDERGIVLDEWRTRGQSANGRVFDSLADFYLAGTAYDGHSPIGGKEAIETITAEDLRRFYDDWYRPDNAAVIVVGDLDVDRVEEEVVARFSSAVSRGSTPSVSEIEVAPATSPRARVVGDPDLAEGFAAVSLPLPLESAGSVEADHQWLILQRLAFDMIATRLDSDALRGDAPFESASVDSSSIVRTLDAPEIVVSVDGAELGAATQAIIDEYERVERFGFTFDELDRAVTAVRSSAERNLDGNDSRQDVSYADEYVRHVLEGEWYVEAQREFDFVDAVLDGATPENVAYVFADRYQRAGLHMFAAMPENELAAAASEADLVALAEGAAGRDLEQREADAAIGDALMERPDAADVESSVELAPGSPLDALDPTVVTFANGVRFAYNTTDIVASEVFFEARSPGGLRLVADDDVADAQAISEVLAESGVGDFDRVALDAFLADKSVSVQPYLDPFVEGMQGTAATEDIEVLFQLVNRLMVAPRVDQLAVDRYIDDQLPFAEDPSIDAGYAEFTALLDARYDDPRFRVPTADSLATVDVEGIQRVMGERFGDASDWVFSISGDFDSDEVTELAAAYLGTLPATGRVEPLDFTEPPPPPGAIVLDVEAGQGDAANVSFLLTAAATADRRDDIVARVMSQVINDRLIDFIREELGDSYSPFASINLGGGGTPAAETYIAVSTSVDLVDDVSAAVLGQLEDLRTNGPTEQEFDNAVAAISEQLNFINNGQINDEVLDVLVDTDGNASFDEFIDQPALIVEVTAADVETALAEWVSTDDYIEVRVRPRG